jgi:hypothetical protein
MKRRAKPEFRLEQDSKKLNDFLDEIMLQDID